MHSSETSPNFPPRLRLKGLPIGSIALYFSSFVDILLTYKILWLQLQGYNIFIDCFVFFPPCLCFFIYSVNLYDWISCCLKNSMKSSRHVLRNAHKEYGPCRYPSATASCGFCILHMHAGNITWMLQCACCADGTVKSCPTKQLLKTGNSGNTDMLTPHTEHLSGQG